MWKNLRGEELCEQGAHEVLLTRNAPDIPLAVAIAHILNRLCAVHMLLARVKVNNKTTIVIPRIFVVHPLFNVNVYAPDHVHDAFKCGRINQDVMRNGDTHNFAHRGKRHLMSAERIGMVDLVIAVFAHLDACITRDGEQRCAPPLLVDRREHERVTAPDIPIPAVNAHDKHIAEIVLHDIGKCVCIAQ